MTPTIVWVTTGLLAAMSAFATAQSSATRVATIISRQHVKESERPRRCMFEVW